MATTTPQQRSAGSSRVVSFYEATRRRGATGRKNALRVEINGSLGAVAFDLERLNELEFYDATGPAVEQGSTRILITEPDHPYMSAWWPPGHVIGYEHSFTHETRDFPTAVAAGTDPPVPAAPAAVGCRGPVVVELPRHSLAAPAVARRSLDFCVPRPASRPPGQGWRPRPRP